MENFYEKLKKYKELNSLTYSDLGKIISVSGDTFRMAFTRKTISDIRKEKLLSIIENEQNEQKEKKINPNLPESSIRKFENISDDELSLYILRNKDRILKNEVIAFYIEKLAFEKAKEILKKEIKSQME